MSRLSNAAHRDIETIIHPYTNLATFRQEGPLVLERGRGVMVWDSDGKDYIEGMAGLWCTALGYGNAEIVEAVHEQLNKLPFTHIFGGKSHDSAILAAELLKEFAPFPVSKVFFTSSGSEANDTQVKLQWYYNNAMGRPKKKKIISRWGGYHGVTAITASLTGLPALHTDFDLPLGGILHTANPHHYRFAEPGESEADWSTRLADMLETTIIEEDPDTIAAFIAEPVMGAGGVIVPPETYFEKIQAVLDKYDIMLIADEVICGFGRTGDWFGSQTFGMKPATMTVAKAITSAYQPLGAVTVPEEIYQAMLDQSRKIGTFGHGYTYSGHPAATAAAAKAMEIYKRDDIAGQVRKVSPLFRKRLQEFRDHPLVGEARGIGLLGAVELVANKATKAPFDVKAGVGPYAASECQKAGLITRALPGNSLALCPPLVISEAEIDELFNRLETALDATEAWVAKEGLRVP